ncbi:unnamed protein product [Oikopleura dioica]|uniref:Uncharacterized protein n=1 Tax=Oikopleura dioica TaxID=34765 RepID=E4XPM1_OIKDI|nr:unnamed protein product [Oikopleura dioica]
MGYHESHSRDSGIGGRDNWDRQGPPWRRDDRRDREDRGRDYRSNRDRSSSSARSGPYSRDSSYSRDSRGPPRRGTVKHSAKMNGGIPGTREYYSSSNEQENLANAMRRFPAEEREMSTSTNSKTFRKKPAPSKTVKVDYEYLTMKDEGIEGYKYTKHTAHIEIEDPQAPGSTITNKVIPAEHDNFTHSVFELMQRPTDTEKLPYNASRGKKLNLNPVDMDETMKTFSNTCLYNFWGKKDIFDSTKDGEDGADFEIHYDFPWSHPLLRKEKEACPNTVETNCLVRAIVHGMKRIGHPDIGACPFPITIWYLDSRNNPATWFNQRQGGNANLDGDMTVLAVSIGRNADFISFCFFNEFLIPSWSPFSVLGNAELLRCWASFTSEGLADDFFPKWQFFLDHQLFQSGIVQLCLHFFTAIEKCGNSLTAKPKTNNRTIGLVSIEEVFSPHTVFMSMLSCVEEERQEMRDIGSKYSRDFRRIQDKKTKTNRLWNLQNCEIVTEDGETRLEPYKRPKQVDHKEVIEAEIARLDKERNGATRGAKFHDNKQAREDAIETQNAAMAKKHMDFKTIMPMLKEDEEFNDLLSVHTVKTLQDPEISAKYEKSQADGYDERMSHHAKTIDEIRATAINETKKLAEQIKAISKKLTDTEKKLASEQAEREAAAAKIVQLEKAVKTQSELAAAAALKEEASAQSTDGKQGALRRKAGGRKPGLTQLKSKTKAGEGQMEVEIPAQENF